MQKPTTLDLSTCNWIVSCSVYLLDHVSEALQCELNLSMGCRTVGHMRIPKEVLEQQWIFADSLDWLHKQVFDSHSFPVILVSRIQRRDGLIQGLNPGLERGPSWNVVVQLGHNDLVLGAIFLINEET
jgi:hypothetical protein